MSVILSVLVLVVLAWVEWRRFKKGAFSGTVKEVEQLLAEGEKKD